MAKILKYGSEGRQHILDGVEKLAKTVAVTMGPAGKNVIIGKPIGAPVATKDGVSVAREIVLSNPLEELGCQLVKEAAGRSGQIAGDGTTTSTVLTYEIFKNGNELINTGYSPLYFKAGINLCRDMIFDELNAMSHPITNDNELLNIATISSNNDSELGKVISDAYIAVGKNGLVVAEAAPGIKTTHRIIDGLEIDSGFINQLFLPKGESKIVLSNTAIMIVDQEIVSINEKSQFFQVIAKFAETKQNLLIICSDLKKDAFEFFTNNFTRGNLNVAVIKVPKYQRNRSQWLYDLCSLTSAQGVGGDFNIALDSFSPLMLGFAERVIIDSYKTKIINPKKNAGLIEERVRIYTESINHLIGDSDRKDIQDRLGFLSSKVAVISVGYHTELELREKGDRIEDAMFAVKAALEEGYVVGGGFALLKAIRNVQNNLNKINVNLIPAAMILLKACEIPAHQIIKNAGLDSNKILELVDKHNDFGYNTATGEYGNLIEMGVIDPKKVTRTAVENSVSIATILVTTEAIVAEDPNMPSSWQPNAGYRMPSNHGLDHKY